jgi:hypothetical protein
MIVAASTTLLADSRAGVLPWTLQVVGSAASLAANVAVAQPTAPVRVIAARPSFALIGAYELLMRQVRGDVVGRGKPQPREPSPQTAHQEASETAARTSAGQPGPTGSEECVAGVYRDRGGCGRGRRRAGGWGPVSVRRSAWIWMVRQRGAVRAKFLTGHPVWLSIQRLRPGR